MPNVNEKILAEPEHILKELNCLNVQFYYTPFIFSQALRHKTLEKISETYCKSEACRRSTVSLLAQTPQPSNFLLSIKKVVCVENLAETVLSFVTAVSSQSQVKFLKLL